MVHFSDLKSVLKIYFFFRLFELLNLSFALLNEWFGSFIWASAIFFGNCSFWTPHPLIRRWHLFYSSLLRLCCCLFSMILNIVKSMECPYTGWTSVSFWLAWPHFCNILCFLVSEFVLLIPHVVRTWSLKLLWSTWVILTRCSMMILWLFERWRVICFPWVWILMLVEASILTRFILTVRSELTYSSYCHCV